MSFWTTLNRSVFKRTSTFFLAGAAGVFFFERGLDSMCQGFFESHNKGKLWKDVQHKFAQEE